MWRSLHDTWWRLTLTPPQSFSDHLLDNALRGGVWVYGAAVRWRNRAYDRAWLRQARLPRPVISVGNLSVGGTGKTACVEYLASRLTAKDRRVCILSRGYGGRTGQPYWLLAEQGRLLLNGQTVADRDDLPPHRHRWGGLPDEPALLASRLPGVPVLVGRRREVTGRQACEAFQADAVILDDGFQYRRLARDCEIVLVNARMPLGGWPLLPRGPMREPLESLSRADVVLITKADQSLERVAVLQEQLRRFAPQALIATAVHEPEGVRDWRTDDAVPLERVNGRRIALLSSIGDPEGFEQTLIRMGASVSSHARYPDHHRYQRPEWADLLRTAGACGAHAVVTTEKDIIRLQPFRDEAAAGGVPVWVLRIRLRMLSGEDELDARLAGVCAR